MDGKHFIPRITDKQFDVVEQVLDTIDVESMFSDAIDDLEYSLDVVELQVELGKFDKNNNMAEYQEQKQVIVVRKDLNMRKGKMVAQGAHASLAAILKGGQTVKKQDSDDRAFLIPMDEDMEAWLTGRFKKICVSVNSEQELIDIHALALMAGLHCALIQDAGLTEFGGVPTYTTCAIGPNKPEHVDAITGKLPLL